MRRTLAVVLAVAALLAGGSPAPGAAAASVEHHRAVDVWYGTLTVSRTGFTTYRVPVLELDDPISYSVANGMSADASVDPRARNIQLAEFVDSQVADIDWVLTAPSPTDAHQALVSAISAAAATAGKGALSLESPIDRGTRAYTIATWNTGTGPSQTDHTGIADVTYHEMNATLVRDAVPLVTHHRAVENWYGTLTVRNADGSVASATDFIELDRQVTGSVGGAIYADTNVDPRGRSLALGAFVGLAPEIEWVLDPAGGVDAGQALADDLAAAAASAAGTGTLVIGERAFLGSASYPLASWTTQEGQDVFVDHLGIADVAYHERNATLYLGRTLPPDTAIAFFLPKAVKLAVNARTPAKSTLVASGFFDTGPFPADLSGAATLLVGGLSFAVPALAPQKNGSVRYRGQGVDFAVTPQKSGSSRAKFKLKVTGDFTDKLDKDGPLALRLLRGTVDGTAGVSLQKGGYALGKVRGSLTSPRLFFYALKGTVAGGGKDAVSVKAGLGSLGVTPASPPDVRVTVGGTFVATLTGADLVKKGDAFVLKAPKGGVTAFVLDYARETLSLTAKAIDLGPLPDGAQPLLVTVTAGTESHAALVRAVRSGRSLRY